MKHFAGATKTGNCHVRHWESQGDKLKHLHSTRACLSEYARLPDDTLKAYMAYQLTEPTTALERTHVRGTYVHLILQDKVKVGRQSLFWVALGEDTSTPT